VSTDIVPRAGNERSLDTWVTEGLIDWAAGKNGTVHTKRKLREDMDSFAVELAGPNPNPVEHILARTAALSWFALRLAEAHHLGGATCESGLTINQSDHHQRRVDRAHRRLMMTLKTLAIVRKLAIPSLQINLAREQVNQVNVTQGGDSITSP
jgi:hypothetical protein